MTIKILNDEKIASDIPEDVQETIDDFARHFSEYVTRFEVIEDAELQDYHGSDFLPYAIRITDSQIIHEKFEWIILLKENGEAWYNSFEDAYDDLLNPDDLWKYMYFDVVSRL